MADGDGLELALGASAAGFDFAAGVGSMSLAVGYFLVGQWHLDPNIWGLDEG